MHIPPEQMKEIMDGFQKSLENNFPDLELDYMAAKAADANNDNGEEFEGVLITVYLSEKV